MKHSDISLALDALGEKFGITLKQRPNYSHGRVHLQLTTREQPVIDIDLDEALFSLKDRRELSEQLHASFEDVSKLLCGALIVNAATFGQEPKFMLDALPVDRRREICDALARAFLDLSAGDELKQQREWLHRRLGMFAVDAGYTTVTAVHRSGELVVLRDPGARCEKCGKLTDPGPNGTHGDDLCWCREAACPTE